MVALDYKLPSRINAVACEYFPYWPGKRNDSSLKEWPIGLGRLLQMLYLRVGVSGSFTAHSNPTQRAEATLRKDNFRVTKFSKKGFKKLRGIFTLAQNNTFVFARFQKAKIWKFRTKAYVIFLTVTVCNQQQILGMCFLWYISKATCQNSALKQCNFFWDTLYYVFCFVGRNICVF